MMVLFLSYSKAEGSSLLHIPETLMICAIVHFDFQGIQLALQFDVGGLESCFCHLTSCLALEKSLKFSALVTTSVKYKE